MDPRLANWFASRDTGLSSKALALYLSSGVSTGDVPHDSADFGRCHRLLQHMGWQDRIGEMSKVSGRWAALVEIWPQLTAAFEREEHERVYALIKSVEANGYERDGYKVDRREDGSIASAHKGQEFTVSLGNGMRMGFGK